MTWNTMQLPIYFIKHPLKQQVMAITHVWLNNVQAVFIPSNLHIAWG